MSEPLYYPPAKLELITPGSNDPRIQVVGTVLHVSACNCLDLHDYFDGPSGGIESHLYEQKDGDFLQYRDLLHEADAQAAGNSWVVGAHRNGLISLETQGLGDEIWTPDQLTGIKAFLLWSSQEFSYPLRKIQSPQPDSPAQGGVGYHALFPSWNPHHHSCPGARRIEQFNDILVPWMRNPEDDLTTDELWTELSSHDTWFIDKARIAVQEELGDENAGAFSDRVAQKVLALLPGGYALDMDALAARVADLLAARLKD